MVWNAEEIHHKFSSSNQKAISMKIPKSSIFSRERSLPELKFAEQDLTSFDGLVIFQNPFQSLNLPAGLIDACGSLDENTNHFYRHGKILECLIVHLILGFRVLVDFQFLIIS